MGLKAFSGGTFLIFFNVNIQLKIIEKAIDKKWINLPKAVYGEETTDIPSPLSGDLRPISPRCIEWFVLSKGGGKAFQTGWYIIIGRQAN